jgi:Carboxypeptidase regulatory-like domain/Cupin domain
MTTKTFALVLLCWTASSMLHAQAPAAQAPPAQPPAAQPARPAARPAAPAATSTVTIQVTNSSGLPFANVQVTAQGPLSRDGVTAEDGSVRFAGMRAGAYRLRFVREGAITLERDMTLRAGEPMLVDVSLSAAPVAPKPEPPPAPTPASGPDKPLGPPVEPKLTAIPTFLEKNFIGREGKKDSQLGCTSTGSATLVQLREALLNQTHDDMDEWIYVVAGEGTLRLGTAEQHLQAGTFSLVPHTVAHGLLPVGRNPLIFVSMLSGYKTC